MFVNARTRRANLPASPALRKCLHVGKVTLALCGSSPEQIYIPEQLNSFVENQHPADIEVFAEFADQLHSRPGSCLFNSGALWRVFGAPESLAFDFASETLGSNPYKRLVVDKSFTSAQLLLNRSLLARYAPIAPLEYPTDELLITNYLARQGLGVEVHGCGVIDPAAGGQLFLGHSGAGKSTTTRLWQAARQPLILSDDRIILRLDRGELRMYGTPWHGEAAFAEPGEARLDRIFLLQHGSENHIRLMSKAQALGEVFARCFPPFHSPAGLEGVLEFINRVLDAVPCYEFQFVPDQSAVEAVLEFHE